MSKGMIQFVLAALKDPKSVSTPFPTLKFLAQSLIKHSDMSAEDHILELGCGSGAITKHILDQGPMDSYLGVELNGDLVKYLQNTYPDVPFIKASADNLESYVDDESIDVVISSLPWTMFSSAVQEAILKEILRVLKPGGCFMTFICLHALAYPGANRVKKMFKDSFTEFDLCETISRNLPPANVYRAIK